MQHDDEDIISDSEDELFPLYSQSQQLRQTLSTENLNSQIKDRLSQQIDSPPPTFKYDRQPPNVQQTLDFQQSLEPLDVGLENEEDDGVFFNCTQMQSAHETVMEEERILNKQAKSIMSIMSFKFVEEPEVPKLNGTKKNKSSSVQKPSRLKAQKPTINKKKNQSMSKNVRDLYNGSENGFREVMVEQQQTRIDEFVGNKVNGTLKYKKMEQLRTDRILMNASEWYSFSKSIKVKFPKTLFQDKLEIDEIEDSEDEINSDDEIDMCRLWNESKSDLHLSMEELKHLYNK
ncbi:hypothetical protein KGF54_005018 [Candida jiufengensis]|uniref:uncharacterized protein n=1 Tax=Candida jiufengensis TaxID=497108 RepID=UPI002224248A|nr:uncharacterized protein KGF54_005018 [Candida jiufengensis]KAI5951943.1 hypothetical protein KGF54_005018 [Candida jiufengensis]